MIRLHVIAVTYNSAAHITDCLYSVVNSSFSIPIQASVTVIDNHSSDDTTDVLARLFPEIRVIRNGENVGFGRAVNQAVRSSERRDTDHYLVLNPDVVLDGDTLDRMVGFMETTPRCGLATCKIVGPTNRPAISYWEFHTVGTELVRLLRVGRLIPRSTLGFLVRLFPWGQARTYLANYSTPDSVFKVPVVSGACLLVRGTAIGEKDIFDERFFLYYEDMDLCRRMSLSGWDVYAILNCSAKHLVGASSRGKMAAFCEKNEHRSMFLYHTKHDGRGRVAILGTAYLLYNLVAFVALSFANLPLRSFALERQRDIVAYAIKVSWQAVRWCASAKRVFMLPFLDQEGAHGTTALLG